MHRVQHKHDGEMEAAKGGEVDVRGCVPKAARRREPMQKAKGSNGFVSRLQYLTPFCRNVAAKLVVVGLAA